MATTSSTAVAKAAKILIDKINNAGPEPSLEVIDAEFLLNLKTVLKQIAETADAELAQI